MRETVEVLEEREGLFQNTGQRCYQVLRCKPGVETSTEQLSVFAL